MALACDRTVRIRATSRAGQSPRTTGAQISLPLRIHVRVLVLVLRKRGPGGGAGGGAGAGGLLAIFVVFLGIRFATVACCAVTVPFILRQFNMAWTDGKIEKLFKFIVAAVVLFFRARIVNSTSGQEKAKERKRD